METKIKPKIGQFIYLSDTTARNLRVFAAVENTTLSAVVEEALKAYLPKYTVQPN
ncbi:hypothetical protein [Floridanema evergladense]|uniref:CopG family transcriptional regulator n=1 Tax=Floridaenema evergladense BLCC-F167 TaxID=3153639 RepID=A0ABV4WCW1_9CYAN